MTSPDTASYLGRSLASDEDRPKLPWLKFANPGDAYTIDITDKGMAPDYEYKKDPDAPKVQKTWPNGDLKEFLVITGTTEGGEEVNLAVKGRLQTMALAKAVHEAGDAARNADGKPDVAPGGKLWMKFTKWTTSKSGYDAKDFEAKYQAPAKASVDTASFLAPGGSGPLRAPAGAAQDSAPPF